MLTKPLPTYYEVYGQPNLPVDSSLQKTNENLNVLIMAVGIIAILVITYKVVNAGIEKSTTFK